MKSYKRLIIFFILIFIFFLVIGNIAIIKYEKNDTREYRVQINRLARDIELEGYNETMLEAYPLIKSVVACDGSDEFYTGGNNDYLLKRVENELYRFEYVTDHSYRHFLVVFNCILLLYTLITTCILFYIKHHIIGNFERLKNVPYEISKGNLTVPLKESKSKYFGKFVWGLDLLRERVEQQKMEELKLQKEKKTLILSISHDIKTPLSAIKLYAKAWSKNLYSDRERQLEIAKHIEEKADEISGFVSQIIQASSEDFLHLEVNNAEFYLKDLVEKIQHYYVEKLQLIQINFMVEQYDNCLVYGDLERGIEVLQNIIENAIKYGDGQYIRIGFSKEEGCQLITVSNSGYFLEEKEQSHIFESFYRGANSDKIEGSGLGLYICRNLMNKMNGEIFCVSNENETEFTVVFHIP